MTQLLNEKKQEEKKEGQSIENFLYFVGISLIISIIPIFENIAINIWIKTILGLVVVFATIFLIKIVTKYFNRKMILTRFRIKLLPLYIIYSLAYFIIRIVLENLRSV